MIASPFAAFAANGDSRTVVNTEAFFTVDEGDGVTDVELRFGDTLAESLTFNRTSGAFVFSDDLIVRGSMSGASLTVSNLKSCDTIDTDANGALSCGSDDGGGTGLLTVIEGDERYVRVGGDTMTGALNIESSLSVSGSITLGEDDASDLEFNGHIISDVLPDLNGVFSLGNDDLRWKIITTDTIVMGGTGSVYAGLVVAVVNGQSGVGDTITTGAVLKVDGTEANRVDLVTSQTELPIGVATNATGYGGVVKMLMIGRARVQCTGTIALGETIQTSSTVGAAKAGGSATKIVGKALSTCSSGFVTAMVHLE